MISLLRGYLRSFRGHAGACALGGSTSTAGSPDVPVTGRVVQLLTGGVTPRCIATALSDAAGTWTFARLSHRPDGAGYTVIAYDHTGVHDPVAKANLIPTPMPPDPAEHP